MITALPNKRYNGNHKSTEIEDDQNTNNRCEERRG